MRCLLDVAGGAGDGEVVGGVAATSGERDDVVEVDVVVRDPAIAEVAGTVVPFDDVASTYWFGCRVLLPCSAGCAGVVAVFPAFRGDGFESLWCESVGAFLKRQRPWSSLFRDEVVGEVAHVGDGSSTHCGVG